MHHGTCVTHVPWCMSGSLTRAGDETFPTFPAHAQSVNLQIWQEAHACRHQIMVSTNPGFLLVWLIWHQVPKLLLCMICLEIVPLKSLPHLPSVNELTYWDFNKHGHSLTMDAKHAISMQIEWCIVWWLCQSNQESCLILRKPVVSPTSSMEDHLSIYMVYDYKYIYSCDRYLQSSNLSAVEVTLTQHGQCYNDRQTIQWHPSIGTHPLMPQL